MNIDKNKLFDLYSNSFGITTKFDEYCLSENISDEKLKNEFRTIQESVFTNILDLTHPNIQLSREEIVIISQNYCNEKYSWMDNLAITALNRWLIWMCWHEGVLKV